MSTEDQKELEEYKKLGSVLDVKAAMINARNLLIAAVSVSVHDVLMAIDKGKFKQ